MKSSSTLLSLVLIGLLASCSGKDEGPALGEVKMGDLVQRVTVSGTVASKLKSTIMSPYIGYVQKLFVAVGQNVKAGDPLVKVTQSLNNPAENVFPLRAPFSGTVTQVLKNEGDAVDVGTSAVPILRIDDLGDLLVEAAVPETDIRKVQLGQEATVRASAILDRTYKAKVTRIFLSAKDTKDGERGKIEYPVQMELVDEDAQITPGMSVVVDIVANKVGGVLVLRQEYVHKEGDRTFVVLNDGTERDVKLGLRNEESVEVTSGLKPGEKVRMIDFGSKKPK